MQWTRDIGKLPSDAFAGFYRIGKPLRSETSQTREAASGLVKVRSGTHHFGHYLRLAPRCKRAFRTLHHSPVVPKSEDQQDAIVRQRAGGSALRSAPGAGVSLMPSTFSTVVTSYLRLLRGRVRITDHSAEIEVMGWWDPHRETWPNGNSRVLGLGLRACRSRPWDKSWTNCEQGTPAFASRRLLGMGSGTHRTPPRLPKPEHQRDIAVRNYLTKVEMNPNVRRSDTPTRAKTAKLRSLYRSYRLWHVGLLESH